MSIHTLLDESDGRKFQAELGAGQKKAKRWGAKAYFLQKIGFYNPPGGLCN